MTGRCVTHQAPVVTSWEDHSAVAAATVKDLVSYLVRELEILQLPEAHAFEVTLSIPVQGESQRTVRMTIDKGEIHRVDIR